MARSFGDDMSFEALEMTRNIKAVLAPGKTSQRARLQLDILYFENAFFQGGPDKKWEFWYAEQSIESQDSDWIHRLYIPPQKRVFFLLPPQNLILAYRYPG